MEHGTEKAACQKEQGVRWFTLGGCDESSQEHNTSGLATQEQWYYYSMNLTNYFWVVVAWEGGSGRECILTKII